VNKRFAYVMIGGAVSIALIGWKVKSHFVSALPMEVMPIDRPSRLAGWPWGNAKVQKISQGLTHYTATDSDGTVVDLFEFDWAINPNFRWEIFDQDEDDRKPLDNKVEYWDRNVARATKELNNNGRGKVLVAWNGAFFGYNKSTNVEDAFHVSPVVLRGNVHYNNANHRWTFGVKQTDDGPVWKALFKPDRQTMEREFDYAAGSVQCLIKDGKPLKLEPFPTSSADFKHQPVVSSNQEAGHIPYFDHMRTCRASIGWDKDNKKLYLLTVKEPDFEGGSGAALSMHVSGVTGESVPALVGGWTVPDVQRFWLAKGVWGAINSDAGDVLQFVYRRPSGNYTFVPPRQGSNQMRIECGDNWKGAITGGGAIMYFLVREVQAEATNISYSKP
jgi:hypothetical protein